jgi:hypothetical protein
MDAGSTATPLRAAVEARDLDAVLAALAPDIVLRSPILEVPFIGVDEAGDLFAVLLEEVWPFTYLEEIPGDPHILHFTAEIKGTRLEGIDLLRFDDQGRVKELTVLFRPLPATAAFLSAMGPSLGRRRAGAGRAALLRVAGAPVSALMRTAAATAPRLLGMRGRKDRPG